MTNETPLPPIGTMNDAQLASLAAMVLGELITRRRLTLNVGSLRVTSDTTWIGVTLERNVVTLSSYPPKAEAAPS